MQYKKPHLFHGPIIRQVYTGSFGKEGFYLQCSYCNLYNSEKEENGRLICKLCFGKKTCEYLTAGALKQMEHNYDVQCQYSNKECFFKKCLRFDFRLYPKKPFATPILLEVIEEWHIYEDIDSIKRNTLKLQHAMAVREPIIYLYERDFNLVFGSEESCTSNAIEILNPLLNLVKKIDSSNEIEKNLLLDELYKKSPYYHNLKN